MLPMAAAQIRYPMPFVILVKPDDALLHDHLADSTRMNRPQKECSAVPFIR